MEKEQLKEMLGMNQSSGTAVWKLNKIQMSGDDGIFKLIDLTTEREKGAKAKIEAIGEVLEGVILKMRWHMTLYQESGSLSSTEYDDKWKDSVTVFPMKDKGSVSAMKEKYKLSTQRIIYFYLPKYKQIARLVVKASGLTADKNPKGELGLFEYIDSFSQDEMLPCQFLTACKGVFREGLNTDGSKNKRKDHFAMSFSRGRELAESQFEKVQKMMVEVNEKTNAPKPEEEAMEKLDKAIDEGIDYPQDEINPDDIPF